MPKKFSADVRSKAVRLVEEHARYHQCSLASACEAIAPKIGVSHHTLRNWLKAARAERRPVVEMTYDQLQARVNYLETRLDESERAIEILKAASAFFAKELDHPGPR